MSKLLLNNLLLECLVLMYIFVSARARVASVRACVPLPLLSLRFGKEMARTEDYIFLLLLPHLQGTCSEETSQVELVAL